MRSLFFGSLAVLIAWTVAFGAYVYYDYRLSVGLTAFSGQDILLMVIANQLTWLVGILFFGMLALILRPANREP